MGKRNSNTQRAKRKVNYFQGVERDRARHEGYASDDTATDPDYCTGFTVVFDVEARQSRDIRSAIAKKMGSWAIPVPKDRKSHRPIELNVLGFSETTGHEALHLYTTEQVVDAVTDKLSGFDLTTLVAIKGVANFPHPNRGLMAIGAEMTEESEALFNGARGQVQAYLSEINGYMPVEMKNWFPYVNLGSMPSGTHPSVKSDILQAVHATVGDQIEVGLPRVIASSYRGWTASS